MKDFQRNVVEKFDRNSYSNFLCGMCFSTSPKISFSSNENEDKIESLREKIDLLNKMIMENPVKQKDKERNNKIMNNIIEIESVILNLQNYKDQEQFVNNTRTTAEVFSSITGKDPGEFEDIILEFSQQTKEMNTLNNEISQAIETPLFDENFGETFGDNPPPPHLPPPPIETKRMDNFVLPKVPLGEIKTENQQRLNKEKKKQLLEDY